MRYWSNPYNHAMNSRPATLSMVAESLHEDGFTVLNWPTSAIPVMRVTSSDDQPWVEASLPFVYVCSLDSIGKVETSEPLRSYLLIINESQIDTWGAQVPESIVGKTAVILAKSVDVAHVVERVSNFLISIQELCATLALAVSSPSLCQALINIGEDFFNCYMHITDSSHFLLGYARHVKALDDVARSLQKYKYHRKEILERRGIELINERLSRNGLKIASPSENFPMGLVSKPLHVHGQFAAYIVFQIDQDRMTPGTLDALEMFTYYCGKVLERRMGLENRRDPHRQNLLFHLVVDEGLSRTFVKEQCESIGFPNQGAFVLMEAQWDASYEMRIPSFAEDLGNGIGHPLTLDDSGRVLVLFQGNTDEELIQNIQAALQEQPLAEAQLIRLSDIYHSLLSTYYARKSLRIIEEYEERLEDFRAIECKEGSAGNDEKSKVYSFRDVFCLFWNDPDANDFMKRFAAGHSLVARIARDDKDKGTDNLDVLTDYLVNERRVSVVAQNTHMHRNGVLYRIKRIQTMYHIDFDDFAARQYVLTSLQIRASMGLTHEVVPEQFPEVEPREDNLPQRPDIPRDSEYDLKVYMA